MHLCCTFVADARLAEYGAMPSPPDLLAGEPSEPEAASSRATGTAG